MGVPYSIGLHRTLKTIHRRAAEINTTHLRVASLSACPVVEADGHVRQDGHGLQLHRQTVEGDSNAWPRNHHN